MPKVPAGFQSNSCYSRENWRQKPWKAVNKRKDSVGSAAQMTEISGAAGTPAVPGSTKINIARTSSNGWRLSHGEHLLPHAGQHAVHVDGLDLQPVAAGGQGRGGALGIGPGDGDIATCVVNRQPHARLHGAELGVAGVGVGAQDLVVVVVQGGDLQAAAEVAGTARGVSRTGSRELQLAEGLELLCKIPRAA